MFKSLLVATVLLSSVQSHARFFDFILGDSLANIFTDGHGQDVPLKVGSKQAALDYRAQFKKQMGITSYTDSLGLTQYDGNDIGLALIKSGKTD